MQKREDNRPAGDGARRSASDDRAPQEHHVVRRGESRATTSKLALVVRDPSPGGSAEISRVPIQGYLAHKKRPTP